MSDDPEKEHAELIDWLMGLTEHDVSPDAYDVIIKTLNAVVLHVFRRSAQPHHAEVTDLASAVGIICLRRRALARYGLVFMREALTFREEDYAQPITVGPSTTLEALIDTLYAASIGYSKRYMPPDRGSVTDFEAYYSNLTYAELFEDARTLPTISALNRILALFKRLAELACADAVVHPDNRYRAASLSGVIEDHIRNSFSADVAERFDLAAAFTFGELVDHGRFRDMAERIASGEFCKVRSGPIVIK